MRDFLVYEKDFQGCATISARAGTNGYHGGDAGHGCTTVVELKAKGGDFVFTRFTPEWIRITALGDSELHELLDAMEWIVETIKENINSKTV